MAETREPKKAPFPYGQFKGLPGTAATNGVRNTFFGRRDKLYADFTARDTVRLSGINVWYYVLDDQNRRVDGDRPISNAGERRNITTSEGTGPDPFQRTRHAGFALYGERVRLGQPLKSSSVLQEVEPDWPYLEPLLVRGVLTEPEHEEEPDERGVIYVRRARFHLARIMCEQEWDFQPQPGDIVRFEKIADQYMDVNEVTRDETRFSTDGFFVSYILSLVKSSKYEPQRKIASRKQATTEPAPQGMPPPNPAADPTAPDISGRRGFTS